MEVEEQTNRAAREVELRLVVSVRAILGITRRVTTEPVAGGNNHSLKFNCGLSHPPPIQTTEASRNYEKHLFSYSVFGWRSVWSAIGWLGGGLLLMKSSQMDSKKTTNAPLANHRQTHKHTHTITHTHTHAHATHTCTHTHTHLHAHTHTHTHTHTLASKKHTQSLRASARWLLGCVRALECVEGK